MLEPWLWNQQGRLTFYKKNIYWKLFAYQAFKRATLIHAITPLERDNLIKLFPHNKIEIIPNAVECNFEDNFIYREVEPVLLFLGRIEPKKGIDILIKSFIEAKLERKWRLIIAGPVWSENYQRYLSSLVRDSGMGDRIQFIGPIFGDKKIEIMKNSWALFTPSHSEVVGLVNLEASALRLPVVTTHQTGLYDWEEGGGLLINPNQESLTQALRNVCAWGGLERRERGLSSKCLVEKKYSWQAVLPLWLELYSQICK